MITTTRNQALVNYTLLLITPEFVINYEQLQFQITITTSRF